MPKHATEGKRSLLSTTAEQKHARPFVTVFLVIPIGAALLTGALILFASLFGNV